MPCAEVFGAVEAAVVSNRTRISSFGPPLEASNNAAGLAAVAPRRGLSQMGRGPRQRDITRALRAAKAAGMSVDIKIDRLTGDRTHESADAPTSEPTPPEDIVL
jgi:hypothetical protein